MHRRTLLRLGGGLALAAASGRTAGAASAPVRIGWLRGPNDLTTGKARGTIEASLAAKGASVQWIGPYAAAAPALEAMNAGAIDVTAGSSTASVTGLSAGVPLVVYAYHNAVPTTGLTERSVAEIKGVAEWYAASRIAPRLADVEAGIVRLG